MRSRGRAGKAPAPPAGDERRFAGERFHLDRAVRFYRVIRALAERFDDANLPGQMQVTASLSAGFPRHRVEYRAGRHSRRRSSRGRLPRLAGIAGAAGVARRGGSPGLRSRREPIVEGRQMKRVTGIGGIFFKAKDPVALRAWYREHLGVDVQDWGGAAFPWSDAARTV
jgi:hypothetical protein